MSRLCGIFGRPYLDLSEVIDTSDFEELDDEIIGALPRLETSYTGGSLKWMGVTAPWVNEDPYVDYMRVIEAMSPEELVKFVSYGEAPEAAAKSVTAVIEAGAIGINLGDGQGQVTRSMAEPARQAAKIKAVRAAAEAAGIKLFINARTDVFLQKPASLAAGLAEAERRGKVYAEAGADSLFVPGLADLSGIADMVKRTTLPLNIMATNQVPEIPELAKVGVKRVSLGAWPFVAAMRVLGEAAAATAKTKLYGSYLKP